MPRPRRLSETERRDLLVRRGELTALGQHPAWEVLVAEIEEKIADYERQTIAITIYGKQDIPVDRIIELRGYIEALRWVTSVPAGAGNALERDLRLLRQEAT